MKYEILRVAPVVCLSATEHLSIVPESSQGTEFYLTLLNDSFLSRPPPSNFHKILAASRCVLEA